MKKATTTTDSPGHAGKAAAPDPISPSYFPLGIVSLISQIVEHPAIRAGGVFILKAEVTGKEDACGVTIGFFWKKIAIDPVVGWLVCLEGLYRGRDYRLESENNFIGSAEEESNVCIRGNGRISREKHAIIVFDPECEDYSQAFALRPGLERGLVYHNGKRISQEVILNPYDVIKLGDTKLVFIPFCGEKFQGVGLEDRKP